MATSNPEKRFHDIIDNIDRIEAHLGHLKPGETLEENPLVLDAVECCLQRICEAARKPGAVAAELAPEISWNNVRGMGNALRHDYDDLSLDILLRTVERRLPPLRAACLEALEKLRQG